VAQSEALPVTTQIVDADAHIEVHAADLLPFIEQPWRRMIEASRGTNTFPRDVGDTLLGGRIKRPLPVRRGAPPDPVGARLRVVFPTELLGLGLQPNPQIALAVVEAYSRWLCEVYLPAHPDARGMLPLPMFEPEACLRLVAEFGARPGVVGAFVTYAGAPPRIQDARFAPLYTEMEERGMVLAFHPTFVWRERPFDMFDRFLPVWAFGQPFEQCVHMTNWVFEGLAERFPGLRCVFYEAGLAWLGFIAHRMDQEFMKRPSEAPVLRERPSHYVARYHYCTQPLDQVADISVLEPIVRLVGADHLVYGSNFPQWDFDVPDVVRRLSFLDAGQQDRILGANAARLFALDGTA
jgi:predicted TIM-barrel fold metal-dependent hydrolase